MYHGEIALRINQMLDDSTHGTEKSFLVVMIKKMCAEKIDKTVMSNIF
jgi:hypothetical protein